jgi:hypothetical protein
MLGNLKLLRSTARTATIGFEGHASRDALQRRPAARSVASDRASKQGDQRKRTLKRTDGTGKATTTSMAAIVLGNNRIRPFFYFRNPQEIAQLHAIAQAELDRLVRASKRLTPTPRDDSKTWATLTLVADQGDNVSCADRCRALANRRGQVPRAHRRRA